MWYNLIRAVKHRTGGIDMTLVINNEESVEVSLKFVEDFINLFLDANNIRVFDKDGLQVRVKLEVEED